MKKIGFVGLGSMGAPLAGRLLPGNQVQGTNRTKAKASALIEQGMLWRDTPREAAAGADVVFSMVTDDAALRPSPPARTASWPACGRERSTSI